MYADDADLLTDIDEEDMLQSSLTSIDNTFVNNDNHDQYSDEDLASFFFIHTPNPMFDLHGFLEKLRYLEPFTEIQKEFKENIFVFAEEFTCICISRNKSHGNKQ